MKRLKKLLSAVGLAGLVLAGATASFAYDNDYSQDVSHFSNPSPLDTLTGSSLNQFGAGETDSQIDNYLNQDEQINLTEDSGIVRVLRTNQKVGVNKFVTALIEVKNVNPRELRGMARTICRKEGGDADVLQDKKGGKNYLVVVCPEFQLKPLAQTIKKLDHAWVAEVNDGSWIYYYKPRHRSARDMMTTLQLYRSPDGTWTFDDANNALVFLDQPCIEGLFKWGTQTVDIPPNQLQMDVAIYEVDTRNDLLMGLDWESIKNGPDSRLWEFVSWDFGGDQALGLFPGQPNYFDDHGRYRGYDYIVTTAWVDFMQSKGLSRLLTKGTISATSGSVAELSAVDEILAFDSSFSSASDDLETPIPTRLDKIYDYYFKMGTVSPSLDVLTAQPPANVVAALGAFVANVLGGNGDLVAAVEADLNGEAADGVIDRDDIAETYVPIELTLQVFHDRTLNYTRSGRVGVLLSVAPVVGLESAQMAVSLDVSDVTDFTNSGSPVIEHRYFSSVLEVRDGVPIVLGGIKRTTSGTSASGIPYLRDIPYLGYAFGRETTVKREKDIVVIMTPQFRLCPSDEAAPTEEMETAVRLVRGEDVLDVPQTKFGFDQWMLDASTR